MVIADYGKLGLIALIVVCVTTLAAVDVLDGAAVDRTLTVIVGYLLGNGVNAMRKNAPVPVLTASQDRLTADADTANHPG